jgi:hypothetical protein
VQALISTPTPTPLFSSLRSLEWWDDRECFFPLLRTLLVPTIRSLKLGCAPHTSWGPSFAKSALLASIGTRCPSIQELACSYSDDSQAICEFLGSWQELCHFRTGVLNAQSLHHLASLPSLKSLHFRITDFDDGTHTDSIPLFGYQLDEVSITASAPFLFTRCLKNVRFTSCRSVAFYIGSGRLTNPRDAPERPSSPLNVSNLMDSFSECFSPVVEHISMDFSGPVYYDDELNEDPLLRFDAIVPLLSFSRLTKLDLDRFRTSTFSDAALKTMAQSWPHLEEFRFGSVTRQLDSPSITFIGLVHLIQHCRHLRDFAMSFHACSIDIDCKPFSDTIPNDKITSIFVGISPIVDCIAVAGQLHALLPNLTTVNAARIQAPFPFDHTKSEWRRVDEFLMVLTEGAKIREKIGRISRECLLPT